jgi:SAM-dependent methyltransferase
MPNLKENKQINRFLYSKKQDPKFLFYPEAKIDGFATIDGSIAFYSLVRAICLKFEGKPRVLDYGAGRAKWFEESISNYGRFVQHLNSDAAYVVAADIDPVVKTNRASSEQVVLEPDAPLPFADGSFDIIISDWTFEHFEKPEFIASELNRVLRPKGWICARTPNRFGYVALISNLIPNSLNSKVLRYIQPDRKTIDVFPTYYRVNTIRAVKKAFKKFDVFAIRRNVVPAYHFNNKIVFAFLLLAHRFMPNFIAHNLMIFLQKRES